MSKAHRGTGIRELPNQGKATCPVCKRENVKCLYEVEVEGTLESFSGKETVSKDGEVVYRLSCNGGMIE